MRPEKLSIFIALAVTVIAGLLILFIRRADQESPATAQPPGAESTEQVASFDELRELMRTVDPSLTDGEIRAFFFQEENGRLVPDLERVVEYVRTHGVKGLSGVTFAEPSPEIRRFLAFVFRTDAGVSPEEADRRADRVFELIRESLDGDEIVKRMETPTMHVESTVEERL